MAVILTGTLLKDSSRRVAVTIFASASPDSVVVDVAEGISSASPASAVRTILDVPTAATHGNGK